MTFPMIFVRPSFVCVSLFSLAAFFTEASFGQESKTSTLEHAAKLKPIQNDVEIDTLSPEEIARCELVVSEDNRVMKILSPQKVPLRIFSDTNGDPKRQVDQWSYFENGVEVYRELDTDGNGKQDQFRWLNSAGTRWGIDKNEDGIIDYWKEISAEECSREVVRALAEKDQNRFLRVALNESELKDLALGETLNAAVAKKVAALKTGFAAAAAALALKGDTEWYQLNAVLPGIVPGGEQGNKNDLYVYENAAVTISDSGKARQLTLGTLIKIGNNNWRVLDLPKPYDDNAAVYTFIQPAAGSSGTADSEVVAIMNQVQALQAQIPALPAEQRAGKHKQVVGLLLEIVKKSTAQEERDNWIRQLADVIMEATGRGEYPEGQEQIATVFTTVNKAGMEELAAHVRSRQIMTEYYVSLAAGQDQMKAYNQWLADLEAMAGKYEKTEAGKEAMMQIASYKETADGTNEESIKWYTKAAESAPGQPIAVKARGAIRRLTAKGKAVPFRASDTAGKPFDIADYKGKWVLLVFWDKNSVAQLPIIKAVTDKFETAGLTAVGVNLDADAAVLRTSLKNAPANWRQLYAADGLDGAIAAYWGITAPPYMILYNKEGGVAETPIPSAEDLQQTLNGLLKENAKTTP
ncbi:MAG: TlpA family protein disulfide reductase [Planctomycetaceae bacterium]|jgi:hypothetical protein|nr:TlpA family protein disulfide reductase [Planctomycetaceae bacterium]